jgi:hypothetical protein
VGFGGDLRRYFNAVLRRVEGMIDRISLAPNEAYEFQTGNHYVVVVSASGEGVQVLKDNVVLATLNWLETYSCPQNSGSYIVKNPSMLNSADVLLVRYILL